MFYKGSISQAKFNLDVTFNSLEEFHLRFFGNLVADFYSFEPWYMHIEEGVFQKMKISSPEFKQFTLPT